MADPGTTGPLARGSERSSIIDVLLSSFIKCPLVILAVPHVASLSNHPPVLVRVTLTMLFTFVVVSGGPNGSEDHNLLRSAAHCQSGTACLMIVTLLC